MLNKIGEEYRKSKLFFVIKAFLSVITLYFAVRVMVMSISALLNFTPLANNMNLLLFGMLFSLGLSNLVKVIEMLIYKEKEYFTLLIVSTIFILGVPVFILLI